MSDHAVLCTADKTYSLRQVHSSNTTYLVQPCTATTTTTSMAAGVTATSTITSYLELLPLTPNPQTLLRPLLLPYPSSHPPPSAGSGFGRSRQQLLHDLPISNAEFSAAWASLCAFESGGVAYTPSVQAILKTLREAVTGAVAEGMKLSAPFSAAALLRAIDDPEVPLGLLESVLALICDVSTTEGGDSGGSGGGGGGGGVGDSNCCWVLDSQRCVRIVGRWVLQEWHEGGKGVDMLYITFISKWKAAVPDECAGLCKLELLKVRFRSKSLG